MFQPDRERELDPRQQPKDNKDTFTGSLLISDAELDAAAEENSYMLTINDYIAQDRAYLAELIKHRTILCKELQRTRAKVARIKERIINRQRQHKHFRKVLRKTLAFEKIKRTRQEAGL